MAFQFSAPTEIFFFPSSPVRADSTTTFLGSPPPSQASGDAFQPAFLGSSNASDPFSFTSTSAPPLSSPAFSFSSPATTENGQSSLDPSRPFSFSDLSLSAVSPTKQDETVTSWKIDALNEKLDHALLKLDSLATSVEKLLLSKHSESSKPVAAAPARTLVEQLEELQAHPDYGSVLTGSSN